MVTVRFGLGADHACGVDTGCRSDFLPVFLESRGSQPVNTISEPFTTAYRKSLNVNKLCCSDPAPDAFGLAKPVVPRPLVWETRPSCAARASEWAGGATSSMGQVPGLRSPGLTGSMATRAWYSFPRCYATLQIAAQNEIDASLVMARRKSDECILVLRCFPAPPWRKRRSFMCCYLWCRALVSRHRSSVGLRWPSKRIAALHRLPIQLGMGCAMRLALRSDGCAQPTTSDP